MAWVYLLIAGVLEVAWASLVVLYAAMARLPLGIAYPIWTGIGSVGSVLVGVMAFNQNLSMAGIAGLILLIAGMFLLGSDAH